MQIKRIANGFDKNGLIFAPKVVQKIEECELIGSKLG